MYYLVQKTKVSAVTKIHRDNTTDGTYHEIQSKVYAIHGQYGREDYADAWMNYRNGKITKSKLKQLLNL